MNNITVATSAWCRPTLLTISAVILLHLILAPVARAQTIQWNSVHPNLTWTAAGGKFRAGLNSPAVTVTYGTQATEIDRLGNPIRQIPCGTSVPVGTRVLFEFLPHQFSDISWFGSGFASDSPYGAWLVGEPAPLARCAAKNLYDDRVQASSLVDLYAELAIAPPQKSVSVTDAPCSAVASGRSCILDQTGSVSADFTFAPTSGYFWGGFTHGDRDKSPSNPDGCYKGTRGVSPEPMKNGNAAYVVAVPAQSTRCSLRVIDAKGEPPTPPVLGFGALGAQCVVGDSHVISMSASDSDGDRVQFLIDWNNDHLADEMLPPAGYVSSGEQVRASRVFITPGVKQVNVLALDENGRASAWASLTFSCAARPEADRSKLPNPGEGFLGGSDDANQGEENTSESGIWGNGPFNDLDLRIKPSLVRVGQRTVVYWRSQRMDACSVVSPSGDHWEALSSPLSGTVSEPISKRTVFTLTCQDREGNLFTRSATATLVPNWQER